jgi:superfamily I DNA/RNA helicase
VLVVGPNPFLDAAYAVIEEAFPQAVRRKSDISADLPADEEAVAPSIICTSLISSKGLSAGYVFIVGFNDGHLPRDPKAITDAEVCQFLVGLSRTRKECHLVSVGRLGGDALKRSTFARWIADQTEPLTANKAYFDAA